jgi:hypothetical protein
MPHRLRECKTEEPATVGEGEFTVPARWGRRSAQMVAAVVVEACLLAGLGFWLWHLAPVVRPQGTPQPVTVHWLARPPVSNRTLPVERRVRARRILRPPRPVLPPVQSGVAPGPLLAQVTTVRFRAGSLSVPLPARGLGPQGLETSFQIPGGGGLLSTPYRVKEVHFSCGGSPEESPVASARVWLAGRVNRAGRVVSTAVLRNFGMTNYFLDRHLTRVRRYRFAPLRVDGRPTGFRFVQVWWVARCEAFQPSWWTSCGHFRNADHKMPHWLLYRLRGHHPLAVLLSMRRGHPIPGVAQAVRLTLQMIAAGAFH